MTIEEVVDRYEVADPRIRELFVAYLHRRYPDVDYSGLLAAAYAIVKLFWNGLVEINPAQADLTVSQEVYQQWPTLQWLHQCDHRALQCAEAVGLREEDLRGTLVIVAVVRSFRRNRSHRTSDVDERRADATHLGLLDGHHEDRDMRLARTITSAWNGLPQTKAGTAANIHEVRQLIAARDR